MTNSSSYCSYSLCPLMKIFTSVLKGNVPSSLRKRYSSLASLIAGLLSQTKKRPDKIEISESLNVSATFSFMCTEHRSSLAETCCCCFLLTVVNDVMIHEVLQEADSGCSIRSFLVAHKPVYKFLRHKAIGIRAQVVTSVLNQFPIVKPQP